MSFHGLHKIKYLCLPLSGLYGTFTVFGLGCKLLARWASQQPCVKDSLVPAPNQPIKQRKDNLPRRFTRTNGYSFFLHTPP
jgi:hypothetical protein